MVSLNDSAWPICDLFFFFFFWRAATTKGRKDFRTIGLRSRRVIAQSATAHLGLNPNILFIWILRRLERFTNWEAHWRSTRSTGDPLEVLEIHSKYWRSTRSTGDPLELLEIYSGCA